MNVIIGFALVIRIATSVVISLVVVLPSLHAGVSTRRAILSALPFFLAAAGGFAVNDYHDSEKDAVNKPYRAIPSHRLTRRMALRVGVVLIALAFATCCIASRTLLEFGLYSSAIAGVCVYNYLVKHFTLSKNVVTSIVSALPIIFIVIVLHYPVIYLLVPTASLAFLLGREWLMDIRDMRGDSMSGVKTLPLLIGPEKTARLGFLSLGASVVVLLPLAVKVQTLWCGVLVGLMTLSIALLVELWSQSEGVYRRGVVLGLWFPMSCGILLLIR
jgi:geranylgeranylglycerol-phosphate geranylgeranyltransferase